jgi:hypothetical protein
VTAATVTAVAIVSVANERPVWSRPVLTATGGLVALGVLLAAVPVESNGTVRLGPTTLYRTLRTLHDTGLVSEAPHDDPASDATTASPRPDRMRHARNWPAWRR